MMMNKSISTISIAVAVTMAFIYMFTATTTRAEEENNKYYYKVYVCTKAGQCRPSNTVIAQFGPTAAFLNAPVAENNRTASLSWTHGEFNSSDKAFDRYEIRMRERKWNDQKEPGEAVARAAAAMTDYRDLDPEMDMSNSVLAATIKDQTATSATIIPNPTQMSAEDVADFEDYLAERRYYIADIEADKMYVFKIFTCTADNKCIPSNGAIVDLNDGFHITDVAGTEGPRPDISAGKDPENMLNMNWPASNREMRPIAYRIKWRDEYTNGWNVMFIPSDSGHFAADSGKYYTQYTGLRGGTRHYFMVDVCNATGCSKSSINGNNSNDPHMAKTKLETPVLNVPVNITDTSMDFTWNSPGAIANQSELTLVYFAYSSYLEDNKYITEFMKQVESTQPPVNIRKLLTGNLYTNGAVIRVDGLEPDKKYCFYLRNCDDYFDYCANSQSKDTAAPSLCAKTLPHQPDPVILSEPEIYTYSGSGGVTTAAGGVVYKAYPDLGANIIKLAWKREPGTSEGEDFRRYMIYFSTSPGVTTSSTLWGTVNSRDQLFIEMSSLKSGGAYFFRVFNCTMKDQCAGSNEVSTPLLPPGPVIILSPQKSDITHDSIRFSWTESKEYSFYKYRVYVSSHSDMGPGAPYSPEKMVEIKSAATTSYTATGLSPYTQYFCKVAVCDITGQCAESAVEAGYTNRPPAPPAVTLNDPSDIAATSLKLSWTQVEAEPYHQFRYYSVLYREKGESWKSLTTYNNLKKYNSQGLMTYQQVMEYFSCETCTNFNVTSELNSETEYEFVVNACNMNPTNACSSSNVVSATTLPTQIPPVTLTATPDVNATSVTLSWTASSYSGFNSYKIYESASPGVNRKSTKLDLTNPPMSYNDSYFYNLLPTINKTKSAVTGLAESSEHYFRVYVCASEFDCSGSNEVRVTTNPALVTLSVPLNITSSSIGLSWSKSDNGSFKSYRVKTRKLSLWGGDTSLPEITITDNNTTSAMVSGLESSDRFMSTEKYSFKVSVCDTFDVCSESNEVSAVTLKSGVLKSPDSSDINSDNVSLHWGRWLQGDFESFKLYLSTSPGITQTSTLVKTVTDNIGKTVYDSQEGWGTYATTVLEGLEPSTGYYLKVFTCLTSGQCTGSNEVGFTTKAVPVCGNGIRETNELCDDGANNGQFGSCSSTCNGLTTICGNGIREDAETCDDGANNGQPNNCNATCSGTTVSVCGNSVVESSEECDDGAGNNCSQSCTDDSFTDAQIITVTGDNQTLGVNLSSLSDHDYYRMELVAGRRYTFYATPPLRRYIYTRSKLYDSSEAKVVNEYAHSNSLSVVSWTSSGDFHMEYSCRVSGTYYLEVYTDKDPYEPTNYTLNYSYTDQTCGNGILEAGEACDDGNTVTESCVYGETSCTVCTDTCASVAGTASYCGDGVGDNGNGETCDDGNNGNGDGCDSGCQIETEIRDSFVSGVNFSCAITAGYGVKCWGDNSYNKLGGLSIEGIATMNTYGLTGIVDVSTGSDHACAVTAGGGAKCWGRNDYGQIGNNGETNSWSNSRLPVYVYGLTTGVADIATGRSHTCAVKTDGKVICWGSNDYQQLGDWQGSRAKPIYTISNMTDVTAVAAGYDHNCALTTGGGLKCWGAGSSGQLGNGSTTYGQPSPKNVTGLNSGVAAVTAGESHTCALTTGGGVKCWGNNNSGQIGDGTATRRTAPVDVSGLGFGVVAVAAGYNHTCALMDSGGVKCWGGNEYRQLGDGTTNNSSIPVDVHGLEYGVAAVSVGEYFTCAVMDSDEVKCWGKNDKLQISDFAYYPPDICGNGTVGTGETCDDGNAITETCAYGVTNCVICDETCASVPGDTSYCGNGATDSGNGESCDDGNTTTETCAYGDTSCTVCDASCHSVAGVVSYCGNGATDSGNGESCDDGNTTTETCAYGDTSCTVCDASCHSVAGAASFCGNGITDSGNGETCDNGANNGQPNFCNATCNGATGSVCGNNAIESGEDCDDGNTTTETCAYGETSCTVCASSCVSVAGAVSYCGDSATDSANGETCDDGNTITEDCAYGEISCTICNSNCVSSPGATPFGYCGDGSVFTSEETCDDGASNGQPGYCDATCDGITVSVCGNGAVESGEDCDDGNQSETDACTNSCKVGPAYCAITYGGNSVTCEADPACNFDWFMAQSCVTDPAYYCGNGTIDNDEDCDDGASNGQTGLCNITCHGITGAVCGNGTIETGEDCDDSNSTTETCAYGEISCTVCNSICRNAAGAISYCGDGSIKNGETCDDGANNGQPGYCYAACDGVDAVCGNGVTESGESCDDGNTSTETCAYGQTSCTVCNSSCQNAAGTTSYCGNGITDSGNGENCDDSNATTETCAYGQTSCTVCNSACLSVAGSTSYCGDGTVNSGNGETCDSGGNNGQPGYCNSTCDGTVPVSLCGNGAVDSGEECDDGGVSGGCSATCTDNSFTDAQNISVTTSNQSMSAAITPTGDIDYYKISMVSGRTYTFNTTGSFDTLGNLYNSSQTLVATDDDGGSSTNFNIAYNCTTSGTYYLKVQHYSNSSTGNYTLNYSYAMSAVCGNSSVESGETCDDGNTTTETCTYGQTSCTVCNSSCLSVAGATSYCGNGTVNSGNGETCDSGANNGKPGYCNSSCNGTESGYAYGGHGYKKISTKYSWSTAQSNCQSIGGYLWVIDNSSENSAVYNNLGQSGQWYYIGYTDSASEGNFTWVNGSSATYASWAAGEPNNYGGTEDCGIIGYFNNSTWTDGDCTPVEYSICEVD